MRKIARFATARPRTVLVGAFMVLLFCGFFGSSVQKELKSGGFVAPSLESARASEYIQAHFPGGSPNLILLVSSDAGVDSMQARAAAESLVDRLGQRPDIAGVQSYWTVGRPDLAQSLRSKDGRSGLVLVSVRGDDTEAQTTAGSLIDELAGRVEDGVTVRAGGQTAIFHELSEQTAKDLAVAESVAIPLSLVALVLVFGSLVAASLPVVIGLFAIAVTLGILHFLSLLTDVSVFALNMTTALGLALAIDYSLFMVSRYREELERGLGTRAAVERAVETAGRTVLFSAITVALALAALMVFQQYFLKSFAYAGLAVVAAAALAAIIVLPACLMLLGSRVNALDLRVPLRRLGLPARTAAVSAERGRWYRVAVGVMKRAVPVTVGVVAILLLLGFPFLSLKFGYPDDRVLPSSTSSHIVGDEVRENFGADFGASTVAVLADFHGDQSAIGRYAAALSQVADVPQVLSSDGVYANGDRVAPAPPGMSNEAGTYLSISTTVDPYSEAGAQQLAMLRAVSSPDVVMFGGASAMNEDSVGSMLARMPLAGLIIVISTLVALFLFTGSVVLPVKALLLNMLSLTATLGAMVWIFQDGHLSGLLGFTSTGYLNAPMPILMFCLAFGISMDYEVFLLSRIREEWISSDRSDAANTHAVAMGIAKTGWIFTSAAGLMAIIFVAVATSGVSFMQMFGLGLTLAIIADATVIRIVLVPALMRLFGAVNWWAPKPLVVLHRSIGLEELPDIKAPNIGPERDHSPV